MNRTARRVVGLLGLTLGLGLAVGAVSHAGAGPPPIPLDDIVFDPTNDDIDIEEAAEEFDKLEVLVLASTDPSTFGGGSTLTGPCGGVAFSFGENGEIIDAAMDLGDNSPPIDLTSGGQAFTSGNPFKVDTQGVVVYFGFMPKAGAGPMGHTWYIKTSGVSIDTGGDPNTAGNNRNVGIVNLKEDLPFSFSAKVKVSGQLTSDLTPCVGEGYVQFEGDGVLGPLGLLGMGLAGVGIAGLLFNSRPAYTFKG